MYGGEVILGITQEPAIFDPHMVEAAGDEEILFNIFEGLVKCTSTGEFVPALSTSYTISEDAKMYVFTIRQGVTFHNGEAMTTEDVVYSLSRAAGLDTGSPLKPVLADVKSVEVTGDFEVTVTLNKPDAELIAFFNVAIIPKSVADIDKAPIGTGPFKFVSYSVGESVVLEKNESYWQEGVPYLDKVTFKITADIDAAFMELRSGSIDIFPYLTSDKADQLKDDYNILSGDANMVQIFALNNAVEPFNNPKVREAMNYAVDREELISLLMDGFGTKLVTGMSPAMGDYYNTSLDGSFPYDVDKAIALLTEAGFPDGFSATIKVPSNYQIHMKTAEILAAQLSRAGIDIEIVSVDWATWLEDVYTNRNYQATVIALTSEYAPRDVLSRYVSDADSNFINYSNPAYDETFSLITTELDETKRIELYMDLQSYLLTDSASVYLQDPQNIVAVNKELSGYVVYPIYVQDMATVHYN
jgi:peptide/nickel transport system substrate-binding protein